MRTPKSLYAQQRRIYHPELLSCPSCGDLLVGYNDLKWDKIVQTLDQALSLASLPGHCPNPECPGQTLRLLSAQGQGIAPANSTFGSDVVTRIGWLRQHYFATYEQIHADLSQRVAISASHVHVLYQRSYLPLLTCHERRHRGRLNIVASEQGGLIIARDGLEPEAGEPQLWFLLELSTGLTLRSGWLSRHTQDAFEDFFTPLSQLGWPILAVLSDKHTGLEHAVASKFPKSPHQLCQAHSLRNLAKPLSEADAELQTELRRAVREQIGAFIRRPIFDSSYIGQAACTFDRFARRPDTATPPPHAPAAHLCVTTDPLEQMASRTRIRIEVAVPRELILVKLRARFGFTPVVGFPGAV